MEIRKNRPKLETPFKCYIYCTKGQTYKRTTYLRDPLYFVGEQYPVNGKVFGEFVCDEIKTIECNSDSHKMFCRDACLTQDDFITYCKGQDLYGWHISNIKIYDTPKELREFYRWAGWEELRPCENHKPCEYLSFDISENQQCCSIDYDGSDCPYIRVSKPPQSWCYIDD